MKNKKLVFIVHNLGFGGAQKMLVYVAETCLAEYQSVRLLALANYKTELKIDEKIVVNKLNYTFYSNIVKKLIQKVKTIKEIHKYLLREKPDAICVFGLDTFFLARVAMIGMKIKIVVSERNAPTSYGKVWYHFSKWLYRKSDAIIFQLEDVEKMYNLTIHRKSYVIPNPYKENGVECFEGRRKKIIVSAAAKFDRRKGIDTLIKAFAEVHKEHQSYQLIIYGDGPLLKDYKKLASQLEIKDCVLFPGLVNNVAEKIKDASVFVLPSRNEGIPNVLMEAMGVGVPCIACDCIPGGPRLLTNSGERGLLVPVDDVDRMAKAINSIIENPDLQKELSAKGQEVRRIFSNNKIKRMWLNVFKDIIG